MQIFEKYLWQSSHFQNVAGSKSEPFYRYFKRVNNLKELSCEFSEKFIAAMVIKASFCVSV